jgi:hypothetical protein
MLLRAFSECRSATCHCRQSAAVDLVPHHGVVSMHLFEQLPTRLLNSGSGDDSPAGSPSHRASSDVHPRSFEPGHLDDFKHQVERKQREVSELVLDIRIKG